MKDALSQSIDCSVPRLGWGVICVGFPANTVRPVPARVQGIAERHFERGTNYD